MRKAEDEFTIYGKELLETMAAIHGWKVIRPEDPGAFLDVAYAKLWVTKHVGLSLIRRGHHDAAGWKVIVKTLVADGRYSELAKSWRKLTGIEEEDRRSILELVASFPAKEALISGEELRRAEAFNLQKRQRQALVERAEAFAQKTGVTLWVNEYGPPEARDEPYRADYQRPAGWLKSLVVAPGIGKFTVEVPDQGDNLESLFRLIQSLERVVIK